MCCNEQLRDLLRIIWQHQFFARRIKQSREVRRLFCGAHFHRSKLHHTVNLLGENIHAGIVGVIHVILEHLNNRRGTNGCCGWLGQLLVLERCIGVVNASPFRRWHLPMCRNPWPFLWVRIAFVTWDRGRKLSMVRKRCNRHYAISCCQPIAVIFQTFKIRNGNWHNRWWIH